MQLDQSSSSITTWCSFADGTLYLLLFVSATGVYLSSVLMTQRRIGLGRLLVRALAMGGAIYAFVA
jgi:hypothetical protein